MAVKLKINKKDPPNKREPIVVSDIKDPRLRAYRDSLKLYENTPMKPTQFSRKVNFTQKEYEDIYGIPKVKTRINPVGFIGDSYYPVYKKPVQEVVYKKPEVKKEEKPEFKKEEQKLVKGIVFSKKPELLVDKSGNYTWFQENREGDLIPIRRATSEEIKSVKQ